MALTKAVSSVVDWTAVAQNAVAKSSVVDFSTSYGGLLHIQAFLNTETQHTGTEFIVQGSSATSGDEDWYDIVRFVDLLGTAVEEPIDDDPWAVADLTTLISLTAGYTSGLADGPLQWIGIESGTLVNSELMLMTAGVTNTSITVLDDKTNAHAVSEELSSIAMSRAIPIAIEHYRVRLIVNNTYDINGSTLNYRLRVIKLSGM